MSRLKGSLAEEKAIKYLLLHKFKILEKNYYAKKLGEIDIIANKDDVYHFIEVKSSTTYENAINNITKSKLFKIKKSIEYYLQINKLDVSYCIDAIIIVENELNFLENISL